MEMGKINAEQIETDSIRIAWFFLINRSETRRATQQVSLVAHSIDYVEIDLLPSDGEKKYAYTRKSAIERWNYVSRLIVLDENSMIRFFIK